MKSEITPAGMALAVTEAGPNPPDTYVLLRGNPQSHGDKVEPGVSRGLGRREGR